MIRTFLLAGAALISAPALAQTGTPSPGIPTTTNDHGPLSDESGSRQYPTSTGGLSQVNGGITNPATGVPATGSGVMPRSSTSLMGTPDDDGLSASASVQEEVSGVATDATETSAYDSQTGMTPVDRSATAATYSMSDWNFRGDWGRIGTADWGVGTSTRTSNWPNASAGETMGMGGPIDVAAAWTASGGGELTPLEFGTWILEQHGQSVAAQVEADMRSRASNLPAVQVLNVTAGAFVQADANHDGRISRDELQMFAGN